MHEKMAREESQRLEHEASVQKMEMEELETDKSSPKIWAHNFEKQKY